VKIPVDTPGVTFKLLIVIADNHDKLPMSMKYEVTITVPDLVEQEEFYFDAEAMLKDREKKE